MKIVFMNLFLTGSAVGNNKSGENNGYNYGDIIVLNSELKRKNLRYHVSYKNEKTACIEPPGECCQTVETK